MGLKIILFIGAILLTSAAGHAGDFDPTYALYAEALKSYTVDGLVDYAALKAHPGDLDRYLDDSAAVSRQDFSSWSREQRLAFLINLYNASTLRLIVDHYPLKSIKDIGNILKGPWDQEVVRLFGKAVTLNTLEHKIIRPDYQEPRVHFALVCAAMGCPPLRGEPYVAAKLDAQLDDQGRIFLSTTRKNRVDSAAKIIYLSPIFKWYAEDFDKKAGGVQDSVRPYFPEAAAKSLAADRYKVRYTDYDWSLNERRSAAGTSRQ